MSVPLSYDNLTGKLTDSYDVSVLVEKLGPVKGSLSVQSFIWPVQFSNLCCKRTGKASCAMEKEAVYYNASKESEEIRRRYDDSIQGSVSHPL